MATFSTDTNLETVVWTAGEAHTVNTGAKLTISSDCVSTGSSSSSNYPYLGTVTNNGAVFFNGRVLELSVSTTSGASLGITITGTTTGATGVISQIDAAASKIKIRDWSDKQFSSGEVISGTSFTASLVAPPRVSPLVCLGNQGTTVTTNRFATFQASGLWYQVGVSNGIANQTFTNYTDAPLPSLFIQRGSNCTFTSGSANISTFYPFKVGDLIKLNTSASLPENFSAGGFYYVASSSYDDRYPNAFTSVVITLSSSLGGSAITASGVGSGTHSALIAGTEFTASGDTLSCSHNHGLSVGDSLTLSTTNELPPPLNQWDTYYVVATPSSTSIKVSKTKEGTPASVTSAGTGTHSIVPDKIFEHWMNIEDRAFLNNCTSTYRKLGHVFKQFASSTITFGDGTANSGLIPGFDASIRCPNLTIGNTTSATAPTPQTPSASGSFYAFGGTGTLVLERVTLGGFNATNANLVKFSAYQVNAWRYLAVVSPRQFGMSSVAISVPTGITYARNIRIQSVSNTTIESLSVFADSDFSSNIAMCLQIAFVTNAIFSDLFIAPSSSGGVFYAFSCIDVTTVNSTLSPAIEAVGGSSIKLQNSTLFGTRTGGNLNALGFVSSGTQKMAIDYCLIRGVLWFPRLAGFNGFTISNSGTIDYPCIMQAASTGVRGTNFKLKNYITTSYGLLSSDLTGVQLFNLRQSNGTNIVYTGNYLVGNSDNNTNKIENILFHGLAGTISVSTLNNVSGFYWADSFTSTTDGRIYLFFTPSSGDYWSKKAFVVVSGTAKFNAGSLNLQSSGDQVLFESPLWIQGHTGFGAAVISGTNLNNHSIEIQWNTGSEWNGTWTTITNGTNIGSLIGTISGTMPVVKLRVRITCVTPSLTNAISTFYFNTTTSQSLQNSISYSFVEAVAVSVSGGIPNANVAIYKAGSQILSGSTSSSGVVNWTYEYQYDDGTITVEIRNRRAGYTPVTSLATIDDGGLTGIVAYAVDPYSNSAGAAITGISVSLSGNIASVVTITESKSFADIHNYLASYLASNLNVDNFESYDGVSWAPNCSVTLNGSASLTGLQSIKIAASKTLTLGSESSYSFAASVAENGVVLANRTVTLNNFSFEPGAIVDNSSASTVTVYVPSDQISNIAVASPTLGGGSITVTGIVTTAALTVTGLENGLVVKVYRTSDNLLLAGTDSLSGVSFTYNYNWTSDFNVDVVVVSLTRKYRRIRNITLTSTGTSFPIEQQTDTSYYNPP